MKLGQITETKIKEKINKAVEKSKANEATKEKIFTAIMKSEFSANKYKQDEILLNRVEIRITDGKWRCYKVYLNKGDYNSEVEDVYCANGSCEQCTISAENRRWEKARSERQSQCNHSEHNIAVKDTYSNKLVCGKCWANLKTISIWKLIDALTKKEIDIQEILKSL